MMRSALRVTVMLLAASLAGGISALAQADASAAGGLQIKKVQPVPRLKTPEYQLNQNVPRGRSREWYRIETYYDTDADWMDEVTFTYYVLLKNKDPKGPPRTLLKNKVTYVNIEKGRAHKSEMYIHPSTSARYGDVEAIAVLAEVNGRLIAGESVPASNRRWWEQLQPTDGLLLNKSQTPFALINYDDFEAVKAQSQQ